MSLDAERTELLFKTDDPNEFIKIFRLIVADENNLAAGDVFPLTNDAAGDLVYDLFGVWLATRVRLPIENRDQVIEALNDMAVLIKNMKEQIPAEPHTLNRRILHCLRKGAQSYLGLRRR
jgi:hypothetical protein